MTAPTRSDERDEAAGARQTAIIHATTVSVGNSGLLIIGASGAGKSALALQMMALGAELVADDRTTLTAASEDVLLATAAPNIAGRIEARGLGILAVDATPVAAIQAIVDLDRVETERFPAGHWAEVLGIRLRAFHRVESPHFPAALVQYLKGGLAE